MAPLLVLALLLCHGAFGTVHVVSSCEACNPLEMAGFHHSGAPQGVVDAGEPDTGETSAVDLGHPGYFTVVLAFLGAAVLKVLLGSARKPIKFAALRTFRLRYAPVASSLSWGPSPPLLQVFRL